MPKRASSMTSVGPTTLSQVPGKATFRSNAVNAVAVIPLLSSDRSGQDDPTTFSSKSFQDLIGAFGRYNKQRDNGGTAMTSTTTKGPAVVDGISLVVPNSNLTRPGDWKYDNTPLRNFHWGHGSQRLAVFDGRPYNSRMAHDRLMNHGLTRDWIDLCPYRRTAALIGVLNVRDCPDMETLKRAEQEWQQWAERYSTPPYEVTAHGKDFERDFVVQRLFVFDSSHESNKVDLSQTSLGSSLVAFPPMDDQHTQNIDLHMNVVINDLAVAIFKELEDRIRESDGITQGELGQPLTPSATKSRFFSMSSSSEKDNESGPQAPSNLSLNAIASVVSADNKLASTTPPKKSSSIVSKVTSMTTVKRSSTEAQLLTPLDDVWDLSQLNPKDAQAMLRREVGRREKFAADLSLLAGSPMDAYERYSKAAELCKSATPDPLWYASALEGCAAAHIAMAEAGGFNVDEYLENSFQLPDEMMACAVMSSADKARQTTSSKQTMPSVVTALCDEALRVFSRHPKLAAFNAELLLKLAWYCAEVEDTHLRCQWGMGEGCYAGEGDSCRWEMASSTRMNFLELKGKDGEDIIRKNTLKRCQIWTGFMHRAVSCGALDPATRADVALRCASMSLHGIRPTARPPSLQRVENRIQFRRKASFFALAAAEAMSEDEDGGPLNERTSALWNHAHKLYTGKGNVEHGGNYGWATLRATVLHARVLQGILDSSESAAMELLSLIGEIQPNKAGSETAILLSKLGTAGDDSDNVVVGGDVDMSERSDMSDSQAFLGAESVVSAARDFVRTKAQDARARGVKIFNQPNTPSSLLTVAQSKWADDDEVPSTMLPLADSSNISNKVLAMRCVWSRMRYDSCAIAQKKLIGQISGLRKKLATSTLPSASPTNKRLPIRITSAVLVKSESHADIERVKAKTVSKENQGAMATFFNPYAKKKDEDETALIAEGEERYVLMEFENKLSIPLDIPRCQLRFSTNDPDRIKAPAMSFIVREQTKNFAVQFPFIVSKGTLSSPPAEPSSEDVPKQDPNLIEVTGLHVTCLGRTFLIPIDDSTSKTAEHTSDITPSIPQSAHLYPRREYGDSNARKEKCKVPRLEVVPPQPNLLVSFASSPVPIEDTAVVPAPLADGEIFAVPTFQLLNDSGPKSEGKIEQLRITASGLPGKADIVLFDSNPTTGDGAALENPKNDGESVPLSMLASCNGIDLNTLNGGKGIDAMGTMSVQLCAAHDLGARTKGCTVKLKFRYRGSSPYPEMQLWRTKEIQIRVIRVKGPRVSSLTFRPDLSWESAYSMLCKSLARQNQGKSYVTFDGTNDDNRELPSSGSTDDGEFVANRLGLDNGVHVCGDAVVALLSVANETNASITLSNSKGLVGGFEISPIKSIVISPGVSTKIPMILKRVNREPNICDQLVSMTALDWETKIDDDSNGSEKGQRLMTSGTMVPVNLRVRRGHMRIPYGCLKSIIDENPTFLSRICKAPCDVKVNLDGQQKDGETATASSPMQVTLGKPSNPTVCMEMADWVPSSVLDKVNVTVEFCCSSWDSGGSSAGNQGTEDAFLKQIQFFNFDESGGNKQQDPHQQQEQGYVWIGQIRKSFKVGSGGQQQQDQHKHRARIVFMKEGHYVVSACARIQNIGGAVAGDEAIPQEVWWAGKAQHIVVKQAPLPAQ